MDYSAYGPLRAGIIEDELSAVNPRWRVRSFPNRYVLYLIIVVLLIFRLICVANNALPSPFLIKDIGNHPDTFIAERPFKDLFYLSSIGPKITGSYENEVLAVDFLVREINFIKQQARPIHKIFLEIQETTGSYHLAFHPYGFINSYNKVQNIVVKLTSVDVNSNSSLLINCHFDSVPGSPGTSDDGLNCVMMLEVLRVLSQAYVPLRHSVIFLFNGAEETPLQGSHGFITQHEWAKEVKAFINLEACGAGGREVLFQAGPNHPWLTKLYADAVPHPHALVIAEEIFQSGLVPSDTDFRIFRDFGKIPGLDFAHSFNGYVYHTKFDNMDYVSMGVLQHTGDNILALVRSITSSPELENVEEHSEGRTVYFDVIGMFMIVYPESFAKGLNLVVAILSFLTQFRTLYIVGSGLFGPKMESVFTIGCWLPFLGYVCGFAVAAVTVIVLDLMNSTMSWYSQPSFIMGLYFCPVTACVLHQYAKFKEKNDQVHRYSIGFVTMVFCCSVQFLITIVLVVTTLVSWRSSFVLLLLVLFPTLSHLVMIVFNKETCPRIWLSSFLVSLVIPVTYILYLILLTFNLFIPICGRMGPKQNPEIFIGILSVLLCLLLSCYFAPLVMLTSNPRKWLPHLVIIYLVSVFAAMTPIGFPYNDDVNHPSPQRVFIMHTERTFHDSVGDVRHHESGYWVLPLDRNLPGMNNDLRAQNICHSCDDELYNGLPLSSPRMLSLSKYSYWVPAEQPLFYNPISMNLVNRKISGLVQNLTFTVTGPDHMNVFLSPHPGVTLNSWSFDKNVTSGEPSWRNRPTYFIQYTRGMESHVWTFWLTFEVSSVVPNQTIIDISMVGHYMTSRQQMTEEFQEYIDSYPKWTYITAWTTKLTSWKF